MSQNIVNPYRYAVASYSLIWEETDGGEQQGMASGSNIAAGIAFFTGQDMIGEVPKKVTCYLKKSSTPTGIATLKLISSLNSVKTIFGTIDVSTLTTSFGEHSFTNDSATQPVVTDPDLADEAKITIDVDVTGTDATGLKVYIIGYRVAH